MTIKEIANYIIWKSASEKKFVNNWKIQYLLYFIQEKSCLEEKKKAFEEPMVAWALGPVNIEVKKEIEEKYGPLEIRKYKGKIPIISDESLKKLVNSVIKDYKDKDFVNIMKSIKGDQNGLWYTTYDNGKGRNKEIVFIEEG